MLINLGVRVRTVLARQGHPMNEAIAAHPIMECHAHGRSILRALMQYLATEVLPRREQRRLTLREIVKDFQRFPGDVGSSEVQGMESLKVGYHFRSRSNELGAPWLL